MTITQKKERKWLLKLISAAALMGFFLIWYLATEVLEHYKQLKEKGENVYIDKLTYSAPKLSGIKSRKADQRPHYYCSYGVHKAFHLHLLSV